LAERVRLIDSRTTARYTHDKRRDDEARRLADAFRIESPAQGEEVA
jgi:hypothetical protein